MPTPVPPRWTQSIRFRLALAYALAVFTTGAVLIGSMYMWQVSKLDESIAVRTEIGFQLDRSGRLMPVLGINSSEAQRVQMEAAERLTDRAALENLRKATLVGLAALFVAAFGIGWVMATSALRPVNRMARVAREITGSDLSRRISARGPDDELRHLADTFDAMLDRLQGAFEDQRRFVQDASHELRNPLAAARTNLELALTNPDATVEELRHSADVAHRSTERMGAMVDQLLKQARVGVPEVTRTNVDLAATATDVAEEFRAAARSRNLRLAVHAPDPVVLKADGSALRRAAANLVSNAVRLAPEDTEIRIQVGVDGRQAVLSVIDEGPGLTAEHQDRVFERFWRGDDSGAGTGLGLSIVRQIAERHGGVALVGSGPDTGSTFTVKLPMMGQQPSSTAPPASSLNESDPNSVRPTTIVGG